MNEKIQLKLAIMTVWAELAENLETKLKSQEEVTNDLKTKIEEEANKDEAERNSWWLKSYQNDLANEQRRTEAYKEVQKQIYKLMD